MKLVPTLLVGNLAYGVTYTFILALYIEQGCQTDTRAFGGSYQVNASLLGASNTIMIIVTTVIMEQFLKPYFVKMKFRFTTNRRVACGIALGILSALSAGIIEIVRRNAKSTGITSN